MPEAGRWAWWWGSARGRCFACGIRPELCCSARDLTECLEVRRERRATGRRHREPGARDLAEVSLAYRHVAGGLEGGGLLAQGRVAELDRVAHECELGLVGSREERRDRERHGALQQRIEPVARMIGSWAIRHGRRPVRAPTPTAGAPPWQHPRSRRTRPNPGRRAA